MRFNNFDKFIILNEFGKIIGVFGLRFVCLGFGIKSDSFSVGFVRVGLVYLFWVFGLGWRSKPICFVG
mgnify:CR=1 FL=1